MKIPTPTLILLVGFSLPFLAHADRPRDKFETASARKPSPRNIDLQRRKKGELEALKRAHLEFARETEGKKNAEKPGHQHDDKGKPGHQHDDKFSEAHRKLAEAVKAGKLSWEDADKKMKALMAKGGQKKDAKGKPRPGHDDKGRPGPRELHKGNIRKQPTAPRKHTAPPRRSRGPATAPGPQMLRSIEQRLMKMEGRIRALESRRQQRPPRRRR